MKKIMIDFSPCQTIDALHQELMDKLSFPDFYGKNIDALWDLLTGYCETPMHIYLKENIKTSADIRHEMKLIKEILLDFQNEYPENIITFL